MATDQAFLEEDHSTRLIVVSSIFTGLAAVLLVLRILARRVKRAPLALDDHFAMAATISLLAMNLAACLLAHYGIGRHLLYVQQNPENLVKIGKSRVAFAFLYPTCVSLGKLSILALIVRIFGVGSKVIKVGTYVNAIWIILLWIGLTLTVAFQCRPLSSNWGEPYSCVSSFTISVVGGVLDALSDLGALILPQPTIWSLQLSFRRKLAVSLVFLFGTFATVVSIVRIPLLKGANKVEDNDLTFYSVNGVLFTVLEPACILICANMPIVPGLFTRASKGSEAEPNSSYRLGSIQNSRSRFL